MLRFLHLSDIHFKQSLGEPGEDVDVAVRTDLLDDLRSLDSGSRPVDAVLVVGDLAARGKAAEYALAREFLDEVCAIVECDPKHVACVPGNHDVDRDLHTPLHDGLRRLLRTEPVNDADRRLTAIFGDETAADVLYTPFEAYNRFAMQLGWATTSRHRVPSGWNYDLDGLPLRLRGVNSALVCDAADDHEHDANRVVVGSSQLTQLAGDSGAVTLLMCHHPRRWLRDGDQNESWLARPHVLLTGHEHELGLVAHPDGHSLTIASGAVNPERSAKAWVPAYNILELVHENDALKVTVRARCYGRNRTGFGPDPEHPDPEPYNIPVSRTEEPQPESVGAAEELLVPTGASERDMIYAIFEATIDQREAAALELGLLAQSERIRSTDDDSRLITETRAAGRLEELAERLGYERGN